MTIPSELKNHARAYGVPTSTIERDYAQGWLLAYLPTMALKGGTGLRKAYFHEYRFSDDLDFTQLEEGTIHEVQQQILEAVHQARTMSLIPFSDMITAREVDNGYAFTISFHLLRKSGNPINIKIDVTKKDNEPILAPLQKRQMYHPYTETIQTVLTAYSLEEIFAEKIRALFERTRPRDLYDIWFLSTHATLDVVLLKKKCAFKNVTIDIEEVLSRQPLFQRAWESSLRHQLKGLPDAQVVFAEVIKFLQKNIFLKK